MSVWSTCGFRAGESALACLWAAALVSGGCGGAGGTARDVCGHVQPCGGDVVGTWKPAESCFDPTAVLAQVASRLELTCPRGVTLSLMSSTLNRDLSATFAADGTYSGMSVTTGMLAFEVPGACLNGGTCRDLEDALGNTFDTVSCTGGTSAADTTCDCSVTQGLNSTETGTYTTSGWVIETTPSGGATSPSNYCVVANQMHFINLDPSTPVAPSPPATIVTDVVLERQ
jgi:hypothetical protein